MVQRLSGWFWVSALIATGLNKACHGFLTTFRAAAERLDWMTFPYEILCVCRRHGNRFYKIKNCLTIVTISKILKQFLKFINMHIGTIE